MLLTQLGDIKQAEAQALIGVMTVEEIVVTVARVDKKQHKIKAVVPPPPGGLLAPEADSLVHALSNDELQRTIQRAGLDVSHVQSDEAKLRARASIALQHPRPAKAQPGACNPQALLDGELQARLVELNALFADEAPDDEAARRIQSIWRGHHAREAAVTGANEPSMPLTFGGVDFSSALLDEFMLTPGEFDTVLDQSEWSEQLLLMYNDDRAAHGLPPLEAEPWTADMEAEEADGASSKPSLDSNMSSSAWLMWEETMPTSQVSYSWGLPGIERADRPTSGDT